MSSVRGFDHVGITVVDLDLVTSFFVDLGLEIEGRASLEGDFVDTVIGIPDANAEIVFLRPPGGGTGLEVARFVRPSSEPVPPDAPHTAPGLRNITLEVDGLPEILDRLAAGGYGLVGGVGTYGDQWTMASVRGPEGLIVNLAERSSAEPR